MLGHQATACLDSPTHAQPLWHKVHNMHLNSIVTYMLHIFSQKLRTARGDSAHRDFNDETGRHHPPILYATAWYNGIKICDIHVSSTLPWQCPATPYWYCLSCANLAYKSYALLLVLCTVGLHGARHSIWMVPPYLAGAPQMHIVSYNIHYIKANCNDLQ